MHPDAKIVRRKEGWRLKANTAKTEYNSVLVVFSSDIKQTYYILATPEYRAQLVLVLLCITLSSALDSISESKIQEAIEPIIDTRTSILIAHRLSTILHADEILVVKDGEIVERGSHEQLVHAGGVYEELYETQFAQAENRADFFD